MAKHLVWKDLLGMDFEDPSLAWQSFRAGVDMLPLYGDTTYGCSCALLRYQPGAEIPRHLHMGTEFLLVLNGSQTDERGHYGAGSFLVNPATSSHQINSAEGCIVLAIWEQPVKFIRED